MFVFLNNLLVIVLGLVFGSFISAVTYRYPKGLSVTVGRSFCDNCGAKIAWFDNIPLLSFLLLGGKCRNCKKQISWRYPAIELSTAIGFLLIGFNLIPLIIFCILEIIFIIDSEQKIIPDIFTFWGILFTLFLPHKFLYADLMAGYLAGTFLLLIHLATHGRGMGLGDVKFAVLGGLLVGSSLAPAWMLLGFLTGGMVGIILILVGRAHLKDQIAFGPFLIVAVPIALIWGEKILTVLL